MSTAASTTALTIWFNGKFSEPAMAKLRAGLGPHRLVVAQVTSPSNLDGGTHDLALDEADVAFGQPDPKQPPQTAAPAAADGGDVSSELRSPAHPVVPADGIVGPHVG